MAAPTRTLAGICEITTGALSLENMPPAFQGDSTMAVQITLHQGGAAYQIPDDVTAKMYLYFANAGKMTASQAMRKSGSTISGTIPAEDMAIAGNPLLVIRLTDETGNVAVACVCPLHITRVLGKVVLSARPPTPDEIVYVGRSPYLGENGHWYQWDNEQSAYVDTGVTAQGSQGPPGNIVSVDHVTGVNGNIFLNALQYTAQTLTEEQQAQARENIGALESVNGKTGRTVELTAADLDMGPDEATNLADAVKAAGNVRNLLDNSDFTNPVNQRGQSSYTGNGYGIDRWIGQNTESNITLGLNGITIQPNAWAGIRQRFSQGTLTGKTLTFAIELGDGRMISGSRTFPDPNDSTSVAVDEQAGLQMTFDGRNGVDSVWIAPNTAATAPFTIRWAALYEGAYTADALPPYVPKGYGAELAECQRYYLPVKLNRTACFCTSASAYFSIMTPSPMRVSPSITKNSAGPIYCNGVSNIAVTNLTCTSAGNCVNFTASYASTSNISTYTGSIANVDIALSAEL